MSESKTATREEYSDIIESLEADQRREHEERETSILFSRADDEMLVESAEKYVARRLLYHPEFDLRWYETTSDDGTQRVDVEEYEEHGHDKRKPVYNVAGTLPIGVLSIRPRPRQSDTHSRAITDTVLPKEE